MQNENDFKSDPELALIVHELPAIKLEVLGIEVNSKESQTKAAGLVTKLKGYFQEIETRRKAWVKPFNDVLKVANKFATDQKKPIVSLIAILSPALITYQVKLDCVAREKEIKRLQEQAKKDKELADLKAKEAAAKTDKAQEKIQTKIEEAENEPASAPVKVENTVKTDSGSVSFRKRWTFEIVNENEIPRVYMTPDLKLIREAIAKGDRELSGIRIFQEKTLSGRT